MIYPMTLCLVLLSFVPYALANVEKIIFTAPEAVSVPQEHPNLDDLYLVSLSSAVNSVRLRVNASFPSEESPNGEETWLLLENLNPARRYEVRICWAATVSDSFLRGDLEVTDGEIATNVIQPSGLYITRYI